MFTAIRNILFVLFATLSCSLQAEQTLTISTLPLSRDNKSPAILAQAYKNIGYNIQIVTYPAKRSLNMANSGRTDGELQRVAEIAASYRNLIQVPVAIRHVEIAAFSNNYNFKVNGWNSFQPYKVGLLLGLKNIEAKAENLQREFFTSTDKLFEMLQKNRIDIAILPKPLGLKSIEKMALTKTTMLEPIIYSTDLYHFLHKKHKNLVPLITDELARMQAEGLL